MTLVEIAALVFSVLALIVCLFQFALALGARWGHLAMGGRWPGRMPVPLRVGAVVQGGLMVLFARLVAGAGGLLAPVGPGWLIWAVVAITGLSTLMNNVTPSRPSACSGGRSPWSCFFARSTSRFRPESASGRAGRLTSFKDD